MDLKATGWLQFCGLNRCYTPTQHQHYTNPTQHQRTPTPHEHQHNTNTPWTPTPHDHQHLMNTNTSRTPTPHEHQHPTNTQHCQQKSTLTTSKMMPTFFKIGSPDTFLGLLWSSFWNQMIQHADSGKSVLYVKQNMCCIDLRWRVLRRTPWLDCQMPAPSLG